MDLIKEKLANLCHEQWSGWMKYLFSKGTFLPDGNFVIPKWAVDRWQRQMNTTYLDLSEDEKDSDRNEAQIFIDLLADDTIALVELVNGGDINES